jgi:uncharacterized OB-fold protein
MTTTGPDAAPPAQSFRILPRLTDDNRHYWTGGAGGELHFRRCAACGYWIHPPAPRCPACLSKDLRIDAVSGSGVVHAFTINEQAWYPGLDPPYVIAIVALPEQDGLRVTTGLVGVIPDDVRVGLPVHVVFEQYEDVWLPFFAVDA